MPPWTPLGVAAVCGGVGILLEPFGKVMRRERRHGLSVVAIIAVSN